MSDPDAAERARSASRPSRRDVLRAGVAVSGAVGLAGCSFIPGSDTETPTDSPTPTEAATETTTDSPTPTVHPTPTFSQDCLPVDPDAIEIEEDGSGGFLIVQGRRSLLAFDDFENAKDARDIIKAYDFTQHCFVGRPNAPMNYWLVDDGPPSAAAASPVDSEDCLSLDPTAIEVEQDGSGGFLLVQGRRSLLAFDELGNANRARDVIRHYGFTQHCFVGRPNPPFDYWLVED